MQLKIKEFGEENKVKLVLSGQLNVGASDTLLDKLRKIDLKAKDCLVLDLERVDYVSSAGIRALLIVQKAIEGKADFKITNPQPFVKELFETMGLTGFIQD